MAVKQASIEQEELQWNQMPNNWSQIVKLDYQNKTNGLNDVADVANEANATASAEADRNTNQDKSIDLNRKNILDISNTVSILSQRVTKNTKAISDNATAIGENKQAIETNALNLKTHEELNSAHGVTGNNVGTEDFAQSLVGGVVLLAANIAEIQALQLTIADAPGEYSQEYTQAMANGVNSLVAKQGDIITLINGVLRGQKDAKQMQPDAPMGE
tara:strand:+ start:390 stop:1037 length:648 start_codon:yes stop_codon:yes gene_type:complete